MDCPSCGHHNPAGARFCGECAKALVTSAQCPSCGAENPRDHRFCNACGQPLVEAEPGGAPTPGVVGPPGSLAGASSASGGGPPRTPAHLADKIRTGHGALRGERKQVTVLFADVMGSMELSEQSDAEAWRRIMDRFFVILCEGVHRFEGMVDKFTGDGIMALFGAPIAHEDHARRAGYAALHLQQELASYAAELRRVQGLNFSVRMGLNSGEVVVGSIGEDLSMEYTAVGHTVGLAQRMEQLAEPGKVYLTQETASQVEGYLALADLGEFQVKGASRALRVHELTGVGAARGRLDISRSRGFSRFVGREQELRTLEHALEQAFAGQGQVIGVVGEAGVGKSRLCLEFAQRHGVQGVPVYQIAGQAHAKAVPLLPVLELLRAYFDIAELDSDQTARERIAGKLLLMDERFAEDLPLLFDFLAVPDPERPSPRMDPEARQRQLMGLTRRVIRAESARAPGITIFEDLHWIDPASEVFLANHVEAVHGTSSLTVVNFRPEYHAAWMSNSHYRQIALAPLSADAIDAILAELLGDDRSLAGVPELIRTRTGGNPFFIEEVVQSLVESGNLEGDRGACRLVRPLHDAAVPASVQAVLAARIDRLEAPTKAVLQAAAVIGREFATHLLAGVLDLGSAELEEALRSLVAAEFVYQQELYPEEIYAFVHPLTQEVAYGSQLADHRAGTHAAVAASIAACYPERLDERAALLAEHWEVAGNSLEAARWHARAAAWTGTSDPTQSMHHWRKVRDLTGALPDSAETTALGIAARIFLLQYGWRLGIEHAEAKTVFDEAERMASVAGDVRSRALLLSVYGNILGVTAGDLRGYAELARQAIALAEESEDPALYMTVAATAYAFFCLGEYPEGVAIADRALELAGDDHTLAAGISVGCPYAFCELLKGGILTNLGRLDEARNLLEHGRQLARDQGDVETVGWSHMWGAWHAYFLGDLDATLGHAQQAVEIAERIGDSFSRAWAWFWLGFARQWRGEWQQAIEAVERSLAIANERRTAADGQGYRLAVLGESLLGIGEAQRAREAFEESIGIARASGHPAVETYASMALARLLMQSGEAGAHAQAGETLARALELTHATDALGFAPMIHVELAELARHAGDKQQRHRELHEAHRLFVEMGAPRQAERLTAELAPAG